MGLESVNQDKIKDRLSKVPAPEPEEDPEASPQTEEAGPEGPAGPAGPKEGPVAEKSGEKPSEELPATGEGEQKKPEGEETFNIIWNGEVVKRTRRELIEDAQKGYDYTRKTMALAEKARELRQLYDEYAPLIEEAKKLKKQRDEAAQADPALQAQLQAKQAAEEVAKLRAERDAEIKAREDEKTLQIIVDQVNAAKAKHPVFEIVDQNPDTKAAVADALSTAILHRGLAPEQAVRLVASGLDAILRAERSRYLKGKVEDAKSSPAPKRGAPTPPKVTRFTGKDMQEGKVADAALRRLRLLMPAEE